MRKGLFILIIAVSFISFWALSAKPISKQEKTIRMSIIMEANKCVGIKYKYNGTTPEGFDNPGFVLYIYYKNEIDLPRTIKSIYRSGEYVSPKAAKPGDLLFFLEDPQDSSTINHVGIYLGKDKFIHMPGEGSFVRIDRLIKGNKWSASFAGVKSYQKIFNREVGAKVIKENNEKKRTYSSSNLEFETSDME